MAKQMLNDKEAQLLWKRADRALRFTEKEVHPDLQRAQKLYAGEHWEHMDRKSERPRIVVNYLRPTVETKVANLAFNYPDFVLKPLNVEGAAHAEVAKHVIEYDWRQSNAQREAKRALRDKEIFGVGIAYDFWLWESEPVDGKPGVRTEGGRPAEAAEPEDTTPLVPPEEPATDGQVEEVRTDRPDVRRISPFAFYVDLECDAVLENAKFCGFVELRPLDEVKRDKRLQNTGKLKGTAKGLKPWLEQELRDREEDQLPADCKRVKLIHYFERERKLHAIFTDEHQKPLLIEPWRWEGDWYPFSVLRAPDVEDNFWPVPPLLWVEHQQREINEARTQHSEWRRQSAPKYQTSSTLDESQRQAVASSQAGTVVEGVQAPLTPLPHAQLQPETLQAGTIALQDLQFISGMSQYETSNPPSKRVTTTEVQAVMMSGGSRRVSDQQAFELFCGEIASHLLAWEKQYSVRARSLPIFDKDTNTTAFRDYSKDEIAGEFMVEVHVGSTTAPSSEDVTKQIAFLMQGIPPLVNAIQAAQAVGLDLRVILPRLIRAALPDLRDLEQTLLQQLSQPMPPPVAPGAPGVEGGALPPEMAETMGGASAGGGMGLPVTPGGIPTPEDPQAILAQLLASGGAGTGGLA